MRINAICSDFTAAFAGLQRLVAPEDAISGLGWPHTAKLLIPATITGASPRNIHIHLELTASPQRVAVGQTWRGGRVGQGCIPVDLQSLLSLSGRELILTLYPRFPPGDRDDISPFLFDFFTYFPCIFTLAYSGSVYLNFYAERDVGYPGLVNFGYENGMRSADPAFSAP